MSEEATKLHNLATDLEREGRLEEALGMYEAASAADPLSPFLLYNIGNIRRRLKRFDLAIAAYDAALGLRPDFTIAHFMRATCLLQLGDLVQGFREYEWRKQCPGYDDPRYKLTPQWTGQNLRGKRLYIYPELFLGDLLQFSRYVRLAEVAGARVSLAAPEAMHSILQTMSSHLRLLPADAEPPAFDYACALMSLPAAFGAKLTTVPKGSYLRADPVRAARWREVIGGAGFRVGVVWQGSAQATDRSFPLAALAPLGKVPGVRLISLQKGEGLGQLDTLPEGMAVETLGDDFDPGPDLFVDTAAAMTACDLVVTADTSPCHLAGALGVRTWTALPFVSDWRWLDGRRDTPWYRSMSLYRQEAPDDWGSVVAAMAGDLSELAARGSS